MNKIPNIPVLIATGVAILFTIIPSRAALVTETLAPISFGTSPFPEMLTLPEFNSTLGALTGVSITVTTTTGLEADVANFGSAVSFTGATATATTTISGLLGLTFSQTLSTTPYDGSIADGRTTPVIVHGQPALITKSETMSIASADFGAYEYSGAVENLPFGVDFLASYSGSGPAATTPGLFFGGEANVSGFVDVSYTYAVPEMSTLWAGLCALTCCVFALRPPLRCSRL